MDAPSIDYVEPTAITAASGEQSFLPETDFLPRYPLLGKHHTGRISTRSFYANKKKYF